MSTIMDDSPVGILSPQAVGRLAGVLFFVGGAAMVPLVVLAPDAAEHRTSLLAGVGVCFVTGAAAWLLPWARWPRWATLVLPVLACGVVTIANAVSPDPRLYSIYLLLVFAWIGIAHPPGTSLRLFFLAMVVYLGPQFLDPEADRSSALRSVAVVTPICLFVAEGIASIAARLRRAEEVNARRLRELQSLVDATIRLSRVSEPRQTADLVAELAVKLLGAQSSLVLLSPESGPMEPAGSFRWALGVDTAHELEEGASRALQSGEVTMKADGSLAFLPLISPAGPQGLIMVTGSEEDGGVIDAFTSGLARTFATQSTVAFERVRSTQSLLDASFRDPLTGVGNRRRGDAALELVTTGDAVAIVDLDHFKEVNDRFGHPVGDQVLIRLATMLQDSVREGGDLVARIGGEEFLLVLHNVGPLAQEALARVAAEWRERSGGSTFSAGIAVNVAGESPKTTMSRADQALYQAKESGRDKVLLAPDPESAPATV